MRAWTRKNIFSYNSFYNSYCKHIVSNIGRIRNKKKILKCRSSNNKKFSVSTHENILGEDELEIKHLNEHQKKFKYCNEKKIKNQFSKLNFFGDASIKKNFFKLLEFLALHNISFLSNYVWWPLRQDHSSVFFLSPSPSSQTLFSSTRQIFLSSNNFQGEKHPQTLDRTQSIRNFPPAKPFSRDFGRFS